MKTKRFQVHKWYLRTALAIAGVVASSTSALAAVTFNFTYQPGITQEQIEAVELAGNIWSSYLQDTEQDIDIVVNIHVAMTNGALLPGKLGGATPAIVKMNYDKFKEGLTADGTANINLLPTSTQDSTLYSVKLLFGGIDSTFYELLQTTANNKALGNDISGDANGLDAYIQLEQSVNWSYDYAGGTVDNNQHDFVSVVLHEIGHSLGFISGIDVLNEFSLPTALDIFRYSSESASQGAIDFRIGANAYFSMDGGATNLGNFSTGLNTSLLGGNGYQASHWQISTNNPLGVMDPKLSQEEIRYISTLDLQALDVIGWNVNYSAQLDMNALLQDAQTKASNAVIEDRMSDVEQMMQTSGVYYDGWCDPLVDPHCGWWQEGDAKEATSIPKPSAIMGLLGLLGISAFLKGRSKKCGN
ncbi:MAG: NF038122 family metalloprotease [Nostocaceae cyanobacterium]|nr:NF038122 family metalloprotease [Nostocaceae cyanobacterium]